MIQRIQTIWLLLASVCAFLTLKFSFFSGNKDVNSIRQFESLTAADNFILLILSVAVGVTCLVVIFLYKDRKMQMKIILAAIAVAIINIILFFSETNKFVEGKLDWSFFIVFLIPILLILSLRNIYKDEKLVKSMDRLR